MSYTKFFYVERALQNFDFSALGDRADSGIANLVIPFAAFVAKKNGLKLSLSASEVLFENDVPAAVKEFISGDGAYWGWGKIALSSFEKLSPDDIKNYIFEKIKTWKKDSGSKSGPIPVPPPPLCDLCADILCIKPKDSVIVLGAGLSSFLTRVAIKYPCKKLEGIEMDKTLLLFGSMISYLEGTNPALKLWDVFQLEGEKKYDKIFSFPPFEADLDAFIKKILDVLSKSGRAVVFLNKGFLFNESRSCKAIRTYLIENGFVEAVIELAAGVLFPWTAVQTALIVLSHKNQEVLFVNASSVCENTRRGRSVLTDVGAEKIFEMFKSKYNENECVKIIDNEKIKEQHYLLTSSSYLMKEKITLRGVKDYARLSELVQSKIMRGAQIKASELEKLGSDTDTGIYYAVAGNINDNELSMDLKALKEIDKKLENAVLKDGDILLVMVLTESLKFACVEEVGDRKIIPASNIYIIRLDRTKIEPLYFKILLESEQAESIFHAFSGGSVLSSIGIDFLNRLQIPVPSLAVQKELIKKYRKIEEKTVLLKKQLEALAKERSEILDPLL